jgi:hypothetical protein
VREIKFQPTSQISLKSSRNPRNVVSSIPQSSRTGGYAVIQPGPLFSGLRWGIKTGWGRRRRLSVGVGVIEGGLKVLVRNRTLPFA